MVKCLYFYEFQQQIVFILNHELFTYNNLFFVVADIIADTPRKTVKMPPTVLLQYKMLGNLNFIFVLNIIT